MTASEQHTNGRDHYPQGIEPLTNEIKLQTVAIKDQTTAIAGQTAAVNQFMDLFKTAIPMKLMLINSLMMFGLFFGVEAIKYLFQHILK